MITRSALRRVLPVCILVTALAALFQANAAQKKVEKAKKPAVDQVTQTLGGADRYLTYLSTDKPMYRPGEKMYLRAVVLHHATRRPLADNAQANAMIEVKGPKGDTVASGWVNSKESVLGFSWEVPPAQAGGEYTAKVTYPYSGHAPAERKFDIRAYRAPRLKSQIKFLRDGYGPGDEVAATLKVERAEGGIPAGAKVTIIARVDGLEAFRGPAKVDDKGQCLARFKLPVDIRRGEGTLAMVIEDGGVLETASKTIPILLQTVDLTMYPEGGELVAGLPNRIYFEAFTPAKKPADLAGVIVDAAGKEVGTFRSEHEGRGRFTLTPQTDGKYRLKITQPSGIKTEYPLPQLKATGAVLHSYNETFDGQEISLAVAATSVGKYTVTLSQREKQLAVASVQLDGNTIQRVNLDAGDAEGILIATVLDADGKPLAERLIFRRPSKGVNVKITADATQYTPGGKAKLTVETTDASGKPISAVVGVTVTDDSILEMIDKREQAPRLPVMVLLEGDVKELADAHVYLDPKNDKAPLAVDLLLGTQGWRRFAFIDTAKFIAGNGDKARRVLALTMASRREQMLGFAEGRGGAVLEKAAAFPALGAPRGVKKLKGQAAPAKAPQAAAPPQNRPRPVAAPPADAAKPQAEAAEADAKEAPQQQKEEKNAKKQELAKALDKADFAADRLELGDFAKRRFRDGRQARNDFVAVRIYAHKVRNNRQPGQRIDFAETLFWHAGLKTNDQGQATVEFDLSDSVTSFRVAADAFAASGSLGSGTTTIESVEPFYIEPKLPLEVSSTDYIRAPLGIVNATGAPLENVEIKIDVHSTQQLDSVLARFGMAADARLRKMMNVRVGKFHGNAEITLTATADPYGDKVTRKIAIKPLGFPVEDGHGGLIEPGATVSHDIVIPEDLVAGSGIGRIVVYPTPLASMTAALERLIREPYGCFEQTSSTTYPLVMAQQYFMSHQGVDPALVERTSLILETGYQRLIGFECKSGGFEWFGKDPGHDALTAYGLLEFTDMSQVRHVDSEMLARTRKWLLEQRDGKGGFARKTHTLHTWIADPECANAYNTWALLEAGVDADLSTEVKWIRAAGEKSVNTYAVALAANVCALAGDKDGANHLLDKLAGKQTDDGSLDGATTSVVGSGGEALKIETTALAMMAWLKNPSYAPNVEKSIKYLAESCKAGRFGSTQSTVLALRAIVAYDKSRAKPKAPGNLQLIVDGKKVGQPVAFTADTKGAIELPNINALLTPGKHQVQIVMTGGSQMPYSVAVDYYRVKPDTSEDCKVHLEVKLRDEKIDEGAVTEAEVVVINRTGEPVPTPMAIVGIPGGLEVRHDQLKELVKEGKIAAYEVIGREVILYWRSLDAEQRVELPISLVAAIPGSYSGPASRSYLYYTDEHKHWVAGLKVEITPKNEK